MRHLKRSTVSHSFFFLSVIIFTSFVQATELILQPSEEQTYKEIPITLVSISSSGAIVLKVGDIKEVFEKDEEKKVMDLKISIIELIDESAKISITPDVQCLVDEDCTAQSPCTNASCSSLKECTFIKTGCPLNNECFLQESTQEISTTQHYCSKSFNWEKGKDFNAQCTSNYECYSLRCYEGICSQQKKIVQLQKMIPLWIIILLGAGALVKGVFMFFAPHSFKNYIRKFSFLKEKTIKLLAVIVFIVGLLLIVFTLA